MRRERRAFSFIEITVVLAVVSMLALLAFELYAAHVADASRARTKTDDAALASARAMYWCDHQGQAPRSDTDLEGSYVISPATRNPRPSTERSN